MLYRIYENIVRAQKRASLKRKMIANRPKRRSK